MRGINKTHLISSVLPVILTILGTLWGGISTVSAISTRISVVENSVMQLSKDMEELKQDQGAKDDEQDQAIKALEDSQDHLQASFYNKIDWLYNVLLNIKYNGHAQNNSNMQNLYKQKLFDDFIKINNNFKKSTKIEVKNGNIC